MSYQGKDRAHTEEKPPILIDQNDACQIAIYRAKTGPKRVSNDKINCHPFNNGNLKIFYSIQAYLDCHLQDFIIRMLKMAISIGGGQSNHFPTSRKMKNQSNHFPTSRKMNFLYSFGIISYQTKDNKRTAKVS